MPLPVGSQGTFQMPSPLEPPSLILALSYSGLCSSSHMQSDRTSQAAFLAPFRPNAPFSGFRSLFGAHVHSHRCSLKFREVGVLQDGRSANWKRLLLDKSIPHCPFEGWFLPEWCLTAKQAVSHTGRGQFCNSSVYWLSVLLASVPSPHFLGWTSQ